MILGLDPGPTESALVCYDPATHSVAHSLIDENREIRHELRRYHAVPGDILILEQMASMGKAVGQEVFETVWWSGRFVEAWESRGRSWGRLIRVHVKVALCGSAKAKDANVRQALIDRFGGSASIKKGGALYGIKTHAWAALAVAVAYHERQSA